MTGDTSMDQGRQEIIRRNVNEMSTTANSILGRSPYDWQKEVMETLLHGKDIILISGTGSGKSLIFQAFAFAFELAVVLVISPLLSLMENQVLSSFTYG
jgi:superfamily II DNA helicase RecQ